jgi:hypothetical protein
VARVELAAAAAAAATTTRRNFGVAPLSRPSSAAAAAAAAAPAARRRASARFARRQSSRALRRSRRGFAWQFTCVCVVGDCGETFLTTCPAPPRPAPLQVLSGEFFELYDEDLPDLCMVLRVVADLLRGLIQSNSESGDASQPLSSSGGGGGIFGLATNSAGDLSAKKLEAERRKAASGGGGGSSAVRDEARLKLLEKERAAELKLLEKERKRREKEEAKQRKRDAKLAKASASLSSIKRASQKKGGGGGGLSASASAGSPSSFPGFSSIASVLSSSNDRDRDRELKSMPLAGGEERASEAPSSVLWILTKIVDNAAMRSRTAELLDIHELAGQVITTIEVVTATLKYLFAEL